MTAKGISYRSPNEVLAHAAFQGQTPDEMYFWLSDVEPIRRRRWSGSGTAAGMKRLERNREAVCLRCPRPGHAELAA